MKIKWGRLLEITENVNMEKKISLFILTMFFLPLISSAEDLYESALAKYRLGKFAEAMELLIKKPLKNEGDYNLLGWIFLRMNNPEEALTFFKKSIELDPELTDSYCGIGFAYYFKSDFKKAIEYFNKGIEKIRDHKDCLEGKRLAERFYSEKENISKKNIMFFARGDYFWKREDSNEPELLFIKGVNLGFGLPGRFPVEFPEEETLYQEWFKLISEMGANLIRVYTILPPEFYRALKKHNESQKDKRLFLIQGIWVELPEGSDFRNHKYLNEIKKELRDAVDVIHGNAVISQRYGHAHGTYMADISDYVLGFIFGREWEPFEVITFNSKDNNKEFRGKFLSIKDGNPFEVWLTEMLDYLVSYEINRYKSQRPVAFMNWPTLDPLHHISEATFREEVELRRKIGEEISVKDFKLSGIFDDDAIGIDEHKIIVNPSFKGGIFASYHVYPYYPDFLRNEPEYENRIFPDAIRYFNYLKDLKNHYRDIPLLISEFGLSTSRGIARYHPEGFHHGGLSEDEQAEGLKRLFFAIKESRAAGGIVFSWIDEWFKTNWMVREFETNDPFWFNAEDPEESFGLMAVLPEKAARRLDKSYTWDEGLKIYCKEGKLLRGLAVDSDEGYLYIRLELKEKVEPDKAFLIAIDTYGDDEGDHLLPFNLNISSPFGFEFILLIHGGKGYLFVDDHYAKAIFDITLKSRQGMSGYRFNPDFKLIKNDNGKFVEIVNIHRRRFSRDGKVFPEKIYNASLLKEGRDYVLTGHFIEFRIPWGLLGFCDPSKKEVIISKELKKKTEGIRLFAISYKPLSETNPEATEIIDALPLRAEEMKFYRWDEWDIPSYVIRPKKSYYVMGEVFKNTDAPEIKVYLPEKFNFNSLIASHYHSIDDFLRLYEIEDDHKDIYGQGMAYLIKGLVGVNPFYIFESRRLFSFIKNFFSGKEAEMADFALKYIDNLLRGTYKESTEMIWHERIRLERARTEKKDFKKIIIGRSFINIKNGFRIKTQVDRVTRDWLSGFNYSRSPSYFSKDNIVPWHEGKKIMEMLHTSKVSVNTVWGTIAKRIEGIWYAPDDKGIYRFPLSEDKIYNYPSNFIIDHSTVVLNDTHGINSIAWDSTNADLVIGCGDHEGKVEAAYYLAKKGLNVYMPTDRFLSLLLGVNTEGKIIGSAPIKKTSGGVIIGGQSVIMEIDEPVVLSNSEGGYPVQYYDTPYRYFKHLERYLGKTLNIIPVNIEKEGDGVLVVKKAETEGARFIGIRVKTKEEYKSVSEWLRKDKSHRVILFHSAIYEDGYRLFFEFPEQTSFGDINIELE